MRRWGPKVNSRLIEYTFCAYQLRVANSSEPRADTARLQQSFADFPTWQELI